MLLGAGIVRADHVEPEIKTQINERSDLFEQSIEDLPDFTEQLEADKQLGIDSIGGEHGTPQGLSFITKQTKEELQAESSNLEAIDADDLNSRGQEGMIKNDTLNELYTDYSKPLNQQHMRDAQSIAAAQDALLSNLLGALKELGVDCKTVKGNKKIEPEYFLQTKTTTHKDTVYNQTFCEELRNKYNCQTSVSLKCIRKGIKWDEWEERKIKFPGTLLYNQARSWGYASKFKKKRWGWHITPHHPTSGDIQRDSYLTPDAIMLEARRFIANHLAVELEQISADIIFPYEEKYWRRQR